MDLSFIKEGNKWVAEFEAQSDFNLHIEREKVAYINIMQRGSSNGEYDLAKSFNADKIFDYDFGALVYPKYIKVVSGSEVLSASVNFNEGGGSGSGSSDCKWEYYKIDRSHDSYDYDIMSKVFANVTLVKYKEDDIPYIIPRDQSLNNTVEIAGISAKIIAGESVIDTGSWLGNIKEADKMWGENHDYSFLTPITEEEFYSDNFDYPSNEPM